MSLLDQFREQLKKELVIKKTSSHSEVGSVEMAISEIPKIVEKKGYDWVMYGEDNAYLEKISELKYGSPIHGAIIKTASDMIAGDGFLLNGAKTLEESLLQYNSLPQESKSVYDNFIKNPHDKWTIEKIKSKLANDIKEKGAYCFEIIWNTDFTKIARVKYYDVKNIRAGKMVNDEVESYWYCRDWANWKRSEYKPVEIAAFNQDNKEDLNQLVYEKIGSLEYYGEPDYVQALTWIQVDCQMGIFHLSNIENGMNPSMLFEFFKLPPSEDAKQKVLDDIRINYRGAKKSGKHMVMFSDGTENAAKVGPIQTSNLDKQLILLAELCDKKILTGHKLTSPLLAGISVSGQLGGNTELQTAYQIYDKSRIAPYRNMISDSFQKILDINKIPVKIKINPFNPFVNG